MSLASQITALATRIATEFKSVRSVIAPLQTPAIGCTLDGGGVDIEAGLGSFLQVPYGCTITSCALLADAPGSAVVDIWKVATADLPATSANSITAAAKPAISSALTATDETLTGWDTVIAAKEWLYFNVDSADGVKLLNITLLVDRT